MAFYSVDGPSIPDGTARWALRIGAALFLLLAAAIITLHVVVDETFVEERLRRAVTPLPDGNQYTVDVGAVDLNFFGTGVTVDEIRILPDSLEAAKAGTSNFSLTARRARLAGVRYWWYFLTDDVVFSEFDVAEPHLKVYANVSADTTQAASSTSASGKESLHGRLASAAPDMYADRLAVRNGTLEHATSDESRHRISGLSFAFTEVELDHGALSDTTRVLFSRDVRFSLDSLSRATGGGRYRMRTAGAKGSTEAGFLRIDSFRYEPRMDDRAFFESLEHRKTRYRLAVGRLHFNDIRYRDMLEARIFVAGSAHVDSTSLDAFVDKRYPERPDTPRTMPHMLVQRIDRRIHVDTVHVRSTDIVYSVQPDHGGNEAAISFTDTRGTIANLTTVPETSPDQATAHFSVSSVVADESRLFLELDMPLATDDLAFSYSGHLSDLEPQALNGMFVPNNGVEIMGGHVDSLRFTATVDRGAASGQFQAYYRDLNVRFIDARDRDQGLADNLKTFAFRTFALRSNNAPGITDEVRTGTIDYSLSPGTSFMKFLWHSVRTGMLDLISR